MKYLSNLNSAQKEAVTYIGSPLLVVAGAGSGKTRVLTSRIAYLIDEIKINPYKILAITFTNKAAQEMQNRVKDLLGLSISGMWVSTFHSACLRILRLKPELAGYKSNFTIYDADDSLRAVKAVMAKLGYDEKRINPKYVAHKISWAKAHLLTPEELAQTEEVFKSELREIYIRYQLLLNEANAMDFDDLILNTVKALKDAEKSKFIKDKFDYILVDEYQDTNKAQNKLLIELAKEHGNITVVGDLDQSIYGFRGAYPGNILEFEQVFPDSKVIKLEQNYRSTMSILSAANKLIKNSLSPYYKELFSDLGRGENVVVYECEDEIQEADVVTKKISEILKADPQCKIAVFYRANWQSRILEEALYRAAMSYKVLGGYAFYERKEIKDILAYLSVVVNPYDELNFQRIANVPKRALGPITISKILDVKANLSCSIDEALLKTAALNKNAKSGAESLAKLLSELRDLDKNYGPLKLIDHLLKSTGYEQELISEATIEAQSRLENIAELKQLAASYEKTQDFLQHAMLMSAQDQLDDSNISLMTLHTSKGLEFDCVFIIGCEDGILPHFKSIEDINALEEERRLLYVGITRAKKNLYLTYASQRKIFGTLQFCSPSRFLFELSSEIQIQSLGTDNELNLSLSSNDVKSYEDSLNRFAHFKVGDRIYHSRWGEGVIKKLIHKGDDSEAVIEFENRGEKTFLLRLTPIKKL
jgi:DNA helicase-2/ATP-dependent DNA helicase PcrA